MSRQPATMSAGGGRHIYEKQSYFLFTSLSGSRHTKSVPAEFALRAPRGRHSLGDSLPCWRWISGSAVD